MQCLSSRLGIATGRSADLTFEAKVTLTEIAFVPRFSITRLRLRCSTGSEHDAKQLRRYLATALAAEAPAI